MKKFNVKKIEQELKKINQDFEIDTDVAIKLIVTNLNIFNEIFELYQAGDTKKVYLLYQLNGQIFKQLKEFNILPTGKINQEKKKNKEKKSSEAEDPFVSFRNKFLGPKN